MTDTLTETEVDEDLDVEDPTEEPEGTEGTEETTDEDGDTFPRDYVERLRRENARYRERAGQADDLAARLHAALVAATGRLADPSDLAFDEAHIEDENALTAALDDLLARKPHLASPDSCHVGVIPGRAGCLCWSAA
ncbi:conserved hypothetical protein [Nostocoides australiense Ben110]|uniref:Uncharacterized protein n=1 Tax=Nostocoides australiense Ben110 TaxID=1193182 RepID=W6K1X4_9MICO|nr:hypothetical protein [Tetrasphaera australiensis]CCH75086.1 conserved hypothetical protein [Tetrasphaera australiensis Ben110]